MTKNTPMILAKAKLLRPAKPKGASWTFLVLSKAASEKLPTRAMKTVEGTINGAAFLATLEPDGQGSHWLKLTKVMREEARAEVGDVVVLKFMPAEREQESKVPVDLKKALVAAPEARALWSDITTIARRDWILWITSSKKAETRARRINNACEMLATGKRRVCCFDRSGIFSGGLSAPEAAE